VRDYSAIFIDFFITHLIGICIIFFASQNLHILSRNFSMNTHLLLLLCIISFMCFLSFYFFLLFFYIYEDNPIYIFFVLLADIKKNFHPRPIIDLRITFLLISYLMNSISSNTVVSIAHQKYYLILQNVFS